MVENKLMIEITRIQCALPLSKRKWERLEKLDAKYMDVSKIFHSLKVLGVSIDTIEYSGHFGQFFYFTADYGSDLLKIQKEILMCIETTPLR